MWLAEAGGTATGALVASIVAVLTALTTGAKLAWDSRARRREADMAERVHNDDHLIAAGRRAQEVLESALNELRRQVTEGEDRERKLEAKVTELSSELGRLTIKVGTLQAMVRSYDPEAKLP